jgi:signal transduction histidine kinase
MAGLDRGMEAARKPGHPEVPNVMTGFREMIPSLLPIARGFWLKGMRLFPSLRNPFDSVARLFLHIHALVFLCSTMVRGTAEISVFVGDETAPRAGDSLTVPPGTGTLRIEVQPEGLAARHKMEGLDGDWIERDDTMFFRVRFLNAKGDQVGIKGFPVSGKSTGWKGSLEESEFTTRSEKVTVPEGAEHVSFIISSSGPAALLGVYAITGLDVSATDASGGGRRFLVADSSPVGQGKNFWMKSGIHQSMASLATVRTADGAKDCLVIRDDDPNAHADWISNAKAIPGVSPGEVLEIQWREVHSTTLGGAFTATYERLPAGKYRFLVESLSVTGEPLELAGAIAIHVPLVLWKRPWFWMVIVGSVAVVSILVGRYLIRRRIRFHLMQEQMISEERRRIALDLHDDLGTRLSHISLVASHADNTIRHEAANDAFGKISSMSRDLIGALSETVWMLSPKNDDLESLVDFLYRLVSELCRLKKIRCRVNAAFITENRPISYEFRHNVSLAVKESVNNALKHSEATEIRMTIDLEKDVLVVSITDNGIGFSEETISAGQGLESIKRRMKSVGGTCKFIHLAEGGIRITLSAPVA